MPDQYESIFKRKMIESFLARKMIESFLARNMIESSFACNNFDRSNLLLHKKKLNVFGQKIDQMVFRAK